MISIYEQLGKSKNLKFTVQEHLAESAGKHYDIRLEYEGIMKSWATRKLPDLVNDDVKRIALFRTEDHSMKWHRWFGRLKSGYGKGTMNVWDYGKYDIIKWDEDKSIVVDFNGKQLKGKYAIIPYNPRKRTSKQDTYLMFKKS